MHKTFKYVLVLVVAFAAFAALSSCKGLKKHKSESVADSAPTLPPGVNTDAWFGHTYVNACAQRMKGNLQEALRLFAECAKVRPEEPAVHYELGTINKLLGNDADALLHAKFCAAADPSNEWYQLLLIDCYRANGQYSNAIKAREILVKKYPARSDFREDLAIDYAMTGQFDRSFRVYEELEQEFGVNEQLIMNKVKLLKSQNKSKEIEKELLKLSESNKNEPRFYAYLAEYYLDQRQPEKARNMFARMLEIDPANPTVHLALHDYYSEKGNDEKAFDHLRKAFLNPDLDVESKAGIVETFFNRAKNGSDDDEKKGRDLAELMLQVHPRAPESNAAVGGFLMLDEKPELALKHYYRSTLYERKNVHVWEELLHIENRLQLNDSLQKHSALTMELFPNQPRSYLYNGLANIRLRNFENGARSLKDGLEFVYDNKSLALDMLSLLGDAYHQLKEYSKSDEAFEEALKKDPDNAYVLNNYAYYLASRNHNLAHAAQLSKQSLALDPDNRNYMDTYGWILYMQNKFSESVEWLSKASSIGTPDPDILEHYGDVLYKLGKKEKAVEMWNAAKEAGGKSEDLLRKIKAKKPDVEQN